MDYEVSVQYFTHHLLLRREGTRNQLSCLNPPARYKVELIYSDGAFDFLRFEEILSRNATWSD